MFVFKNIFGVLGGTGAVIIAVNTFVHIIMYLYYLASQYIVRPSAKKAPMFFKRNITKLQIVSRFTLIIGVFV